MSSELIIPVALVADWADIDTMVEVCKEWRNAVLQVSATLLHRFRPMSSDDEFVLIDNYGQVFLSIFLHEGRWAPSKCLDTKLFGWMRPQILKYIEDKTRN